MILRFIENYYYQLAGVVVALLIFIYIVQSAAAGYIDRREPTRRHRAAVQAAALVAIVLATVAAGVAAVRIGLHTWADVRAAIVVESRYNKKPENKEGPPAIHADGPGESCDFSRSPSSADGITPENAKDYTKDNPIKSSL